MIKPKDNNISNLLQQNSDLHKREQTILQEVSSLLNFEPTKLLSRSAWWGSKEVGAIHYKGRFEGKKAVLKIQGVKPETSEAYMIKSFASANKSNFIRPPYLYAHLPWNDIKRYEALVLEDVGNSRVINLPTTRKEINTFFKLYQDYRVNCRVSPWLEKPKQSSSERVKDNFKHWIWASRRLYPNHPLREKEDADLINKAVLVLVKGYENVSLEFQHAHLSDSDLYHVGNKIVLLSNLYWGYRAPFYDAVFNYHWYIYHLSSIKGITKEQIEQQRNLWMSGIQSLVHKDEDKRLLELALLERAAAGLNLDSLSLDFNQKISAYLVSATREKVKNMLELLS